MALPENWSTVTVTGTFIGVDGNPLSGSVSFSSSARVKDATTGVIVPQSVATATLDEDGAFSVTVPATDDPDYLPAFLYLVEERLKLGDGAERNASYYVELPSASPSVDLAELTPVAAP